MANRTVANTSESIINIAMKETMPTNNPNQPPTNVPTIIAVMKDTTQSSRDNLPVFVSKNAIYLTPDNVVAYCATLF